MPPTCRSSLVNLQNIDFEDSTYALAPEGARLPSERLLASIARSGILHPPILKEQGTALLQLVAGRRRLLAAQQTRQLVSTVCLILPKETSPAEALAVSLEETLLRGEASVIEQAIFFAKMVELVGEEKACAFLPQLGLEPHPVNGKKLLQLLSLEDPLLLALHQGFLHEGVARELLQCSFTDRLSLFEVMELLKLSASNQKKLSVTCRELAARSGTTVMAILGRPEAREILAQAGEGNIPQKTARLMQWLGGLRSPRLHEAELDFRRFTTALGLPPSARLGHSPSFEEDRVELTLAFKNREELARLWPGLATALRKD